MAIGAACAGRNQALAQHRSRLIDCAPALLSTGAVVRRSGASHWGGGFPVENRL